MGNHYHLLAETPEPNLVEGMKWFQGTYPQRFNVRHRLSGHLFQGRYKALIVQGKGGDYLRTVADYIHLNPARAGFLNPEQPDVRSYAWSSARCFSRSGRLWEAWLTPDAVFRSQGIAGDAPAGRRRFTARLNALARAILKSPEDERWTREWANIRRGWYLGDEGFRDHLLGLVGATLQTSRPDSHGGPAAPPATGPSGSRPDRAAPGPDASTASGHEAKRPGQAGSGLVATQSQHRAECLDCRKLGHGLPSQCLPGPAGVSQSRRQSAQEDQKSLDTMSGLTPFPPFPSGIELCLGDHDAWVIISSVR